LDYGVATDRLVRIPSGPGKTEAVRDVIGRIPDVAFGNSMYDFDLLEMARHPFVVNPNLDLETAARRRGWPIYVPEKKRG
jgi:phosphoserine phosphatase